MLTNIMEKRKKHSEVNVNFKYIIGDTVVINDKEWTVDEIRMRYGVEWVYGLTHKNANGVDDNLTIETGSLETILK